MGNLSKRCWGSFVNYVSLKISFFDLVTNCHKFSNPRSTLERDIIYERALSSFFITSEIFFFFLLIVQVFLMRQKLWLKFYFPLFQKAANTFSALTKEIDKFLSIDLQLIVKICFVASLRRPRTFFFSILFLSWRNKKKKVKKKCWDEFNDLKFDTKSSNSSHPPIELQEMQFNWQFSVEIKILSATESL